MFARIRWLQLAKHWRPPDAPCIYTPVPRPLPAPDVTASRRCCPADDDLSQSCAYCNGEIYGVRCFIGDGREGVVHYGCFDSWQNRKAEIEICHEKRAWKNHIRRQRRRLHEERWKASRMKAKKRIVQMSIPDTNVAERPIASVRVWSLATACCSATKRFFAKLRHGWHNIQSSVKCLSWLVPRSPRVILQRPVQHKAHASSHSNVKLHQRLPGRLASMNSGSTRTSRTMTRGAALSRLSVSKRGARLSSWATVRT